MDDNNNHNNNNNNNSTPIQSYLPKLDKKPIVIENSTIKYVDISELGSHFSIFYITWQHTHIFSAYCTVQYLYKLLATTTYYTDY